LPDALPPGGLTTDAVTDILQEATYELGRLAATSERITVSLLALTTLQLADAGVLPEPLLFLSPYFERHQTEYVRLLRQVSVKGGGNRGCDFSSQRSPRRPGQGYRHSRHSKRSRQRTPSDTLARRRPTG
jgi:hypothetical protein